MATITNRQEFKAWLEGRPRVVADVLAARAALRVLPMLRRLQMRRRTPVELRFNVILTVFRIYAALWAVHKYPTHSAGLLNAAAVAAATAATADIADAVAVAAAISAAAAPAADLAAAAAALAASAPTAVWRSIEADADLIERGTAPARLAGMALWLPGPSLGIAPQWAADAWTDLKSQLLSTNEDWDVWTDWYEARRSGKRPRWKDVEIFRVTLNEEADWQKGPAHVNALIKAKIAEKKAEEREKRRAKKQASPPPAVTGAVVAEAIGKLPKIRPAAVEPVIRDGRLTLAHEPAASDTREDRLVASLEALREIAVELAADAGRERQVDQRPADYLRTLADRLPTSIPSLKDMFRLAHDSEALANFAKNVRSEWPDLLASQYEAFQLQFTRTMRQFPEWREFVHNSEGFKPSDDQKKVIANSVYDFARKLVAPALAPFVDPVISEALLQLLEPFQQRLIELQESTDPTLEAGMDLLAADLLESTSNILRDLIEFALQVYQFGLRPAANGAAQRALRAGGAFLAGMDKAIGPAFEKLGQDTVKGATRAIGVLVNTVVYGSITAEAGHLVLTQFPQLQWLERPLIDLIMRITS